MRLSNCAAGACGICLATAAWAAVDDDPYLWLSDIHGEKPLAWVKAQNAKSESVLKADPRYAATREAILKSLDVKDRIPLRQLSITASSTISGRTPAMCAGCGGARRWRNTASPIPHWEVLLDVDKLDADQHKDWVFQGGDCTPSFARCLVRLSPGGGDAAEHREMDPKTHELIADGFTLPAAKGSANYVDEDTILFATDFGPGTMTKSSYPRIMKLWHRGQKTLRRETGVRSRPRRHRRARGRAITGRTGSRTRTPRSSSNAA